MSSFRRLVVFTFSAVALGIVAASMLQPAAAQNLAERIAAIVTCSSASACAGWQNNGSGPAVSAVGTKGVGLTANSTSNKAINGVSKAAGIGAVYGENDSGSGYGVHGVLKGGSAGAAVYGQGGASEGVYATSTGRTALVATATTQDGIDGFTNGSASGGSAAVFAHDLSTNTQNFGLEAWSDHGVGVVARSIAGTEALRVISGTTQSGNPVVTVNASDGTVVAYIDDFGNEFITGEILTSGSCSNGCIKYAPKAARPTVEDTGDAVLAAGRAYVALPASLIDAVRQVGNYRVFVTPEGESNGLYVTQKSARGFAVVENHAGRSDVAFSWRVVADSIVRGRKH
jgi:hypothetical protein